MTGFASCKVLLSINSGLSFNVEGHRRARPYTCIYIYIYVCIYVNTKMSIYSPYAYIDIRIYTYIYIYTSMYIDQLRIVIQCRGPE
jgi:hypothetical protein